MKTKMSKNSHYTRTQIACDNMYSARITRFYYCKIYSEVKKFEAADAVNLQYYHTSSEVQLRKQKKDKKGEQTVVTKSYYKYTFSLIQV